MTTQKNYENPKVEVMRVVNVNINDWTVDCVGMLGNVRALDVQVMSPYFHYANGEGMYAMPEVGAMCWVCTPSQGGIGSKFVLGFMAPFDDANDSFRSGRQNLNPGDLMMRTRDENFLVLRRGGVVQIGATSISQRMFIPIGNWIKDFCENYQLATLGGELIWQNERTDQTTTGEVLTKLALRVKGKTNEPKHIAELTIGSHGQDDPLTLDLVINDSGGAAQPPADPVQQIRLQMTKEGNVDWQVEGTWVLGAKQDVTLESIEGGMVLRAKNDVFMESTEGDILVAANGTAKVTGRTVLTESTKNTTIRATENVFVEGKKIKLGGAGANQPVVKGTDLKNFLQQFVQMVMKGDVGMLPGHPEPNPQTAQLLGKIPKLLSRKSFTS